ncbi:MAG: TonB-dependent siderophore receptor [Candidatus Pseudomonas phytovorans]|uniref:TonB-dependent siderophore receptor n=1 Tax=Candidatus Pseudomonas phytovorans TaxID=3121377 RepID=A0AAJ5WGY6_9PSED|nr:TonB-dependent receptor [Pseudomonas sp.]WEK29488.1 MAG: TonB-dependent siderophore receptor [Pseudomonas sp.]
MTTTQRSHTALALAVHLGLGALCIGAGTAVAAPVASEQTRAYDIAPGPLTETLGRFANAAGVALSFDGANTEGRRSPGLKGNFNVDSGFATLLAGSGLQAVRQTNGVYVLVGGQAGGAVLLGATSINSLALGTTTEGSGSYTTGAMQTATKLPLSIRETPQAVTVITRQRLEDQDLRTLDQVVQATPGLRSSGSRPSNSEFFSRGFPITNLMYDGLTTTYNSDWVTNADMAPFDRVEVVRGATGMMQGSGEPSAAINMVRKRPTREFQGSVKGSVGSWDDYRSELDLSGPLNQSGSWRGRFVGAYQDKQGFQDYTGKERSVFYAISELDLGENTTWTVGASNQNDNINTNWGGLPVNRDGSHLDVSRSTNLGYSWGYQDIDTTTLFTELDHRLANDWRLHLAASKSWSDYKLTGAVLEHYAVYQQRIFNQRHDYDQYSWDVNASGPFAMLGREHELVLGASKRQVRDNVTGGTLFKEVGPSIENWNASAISRPAVPQLYTQDEKTTQEGLYVTTRWNLADSLKVIIGGRLDWYKSDALYSDGASYYNPDAVTDVKITRNLTRYAGVIYDLDKHHSVYASYTDIFKPQTEKSTNAGTLDPIEGENYELGIKGEYFDKTLTASATLFMTDQLNRAAQVDDIGVCTGQPAGATCYEAAGKVRSKGIELELAGAITPDWQVAAGYTFAQAKYKSDADKNKEGRLFDTDIPRHMFKLSTTWHLPGELNRWRVGGNLYSQSSIFNKGSSSTYGNYHIDQGAYAVVGLMAGYQVSANLDTQLNINNLFDRTYYTGLAMNNSWSPYDVYGEPRSFSLSAKYSF